MVCKELQDRIQKAIKSLGKKPSRKPPEWPPENSLAAPVKWVLSGNDRTTAQTGLIMPDELIYLLDALLKDCC